MVTKFLCSKSEIVKFTDFLINQNIGFTLDCDRYTYDDYHKNVTILKNDNLGKYFRFHYNDYWQELVCDIIPIEVSDPKNADGYSYGRPDSSWEYKLDITWYGNAIYFYKISYDNWGVIAPNSGIKIGVTIGTNVLTNGKLVLFIRPGLQLMNEYLEVIGSPECFSSESTDIGEIAILRNCNIGSKKYIMLDTIYSYFCGMELVDNAFYTIGDNVYYKNNNNDYLIKM